MRPAGADDPDTARKIGLQQRAQEATVAHSEASAETLAAQARWYAARARFWTALTWIAGAGALAAAIILPTAVIAAWAWLLGGGS